MNASSSSMPVVAVPVPTSSASGSGGPTFREAVERWMAFKRRSAWCPKAADNIRRAARGWCSLLGGKPLRAIRPLDILAVYERRDDGKRGGWWLNMEGRYLRAFWRWAVAMELASGDPVKAWPRKAQIDKRPKVVYTWEEIDRLCSHLKPRFVRFVLFAVLSGLRRGEIRKLRWGWIREQGPNWVLTIPVEARKQRTEFRLVLSTKAREVLGSPGGDEELVFPDLPGDQNLGKALRLAGRKAGLRNVGPHQFRRTWTTLLLDAGVPDAAVQKLGGWRDMPVMIKHYHVLRAERAREYMERVSGRGV